jgi:hypothetical protein
MDKVVFISYEFGSKVDALKLQQKLIESKVKVALVNDRKESDFQLPLHQVHCDLIKSSRVVLCLLNKKYLDSKACHLELDYSLAIRKRVLAVLVEKMNVGRDLNGSKKIQVFNYCSNWAETAGFDQIKSKLLHYLSVNSFIKFISAYFQ